MQRWLCGIASGFGVFASLSSCATVNAAASTKEVPPMLLQIRDVLFILISPKPLFQATTQLSQWVYRILAGRPRLEKQYL